MRKRVVGLTVAAVALLVVAAVDRFVVFPAVDRVPAGYDSTSTYAGTLSMVNPTAMASGDATHAVLTNVPVTVRQHVQTLKTSGSVAVMSNDLTVTGPDGTALITNNHTYAVDRFTLHTAPAPNGNKVATAAGLPISFPLRPERKDYAWWDSTTASTAPAKYTGAEIHQGRQTFVYTASNTGPVKDSGSIGALPSSLPIAALEVIAAYLPDTLQRLLTTSMSVLPDTLKLTYRSTTDTTLWVDSATGTVIDVHEKQVVTAVLDLPLAGDAALPPVLRLDVHSTDAAKNAKTARDNERALDLVGTVAPLVLLALAVVLLLVLVLLVLLRRRPLRSVPAEAGAHSTHDGNTVAVPVQPGPSTAAETRDAP